MLNKDRKGQIAIRPGNENQEPFAVHVGGLNSLDLTVCHAINEGSMVFVEPENSDLLDMDFRLLERMRAEWFIENAERTKERWQKNLAKMA